MRGCEEGEGRGTALVQEAHVQSAGVSVCVCEGGGGFCLWLVNVINCVQALQQGPSVQQDQPERDPKQERSVC